MLIIAGISLTSCKSDKAAASTTITEVYKVDAGADNSYAKGSLKYMEHETFKDEVMISKTYYNEDQTVKGNDIYTFDKGKELPSGSKFYDREGVLLSTYKYEYVDTLRSKSFAYAGDTDELLRIEGFLYDNKGNMVKKTIYNELEQKQKSFMFGHDVYGNEIEMLIIDQEDKIILKETYKIVTVDEQNRWIEKYGYVNSNPAPATFYHRRFGEK